MADAPFVILGFSGSLRQRSYNRGLLRAAQELTPPGIEIRNFDLAPIPLYNGDVEDKGDPEPVQQFKEAIRSADALLIATPEYNYSVSGVLKNAIDWASRPSPNSVLRRKPVALMGASAGRTGTARSQLALRQSFVFTETLVLPKPEIYVTFAQQHFDEAGNLKDDKTRQNVKEAIVALKEWAEGLKKS
jgi:chromate reductase